MNAKPSLSSRRQPKRALPRVPLFCAKAERLSVQVNVRDRVSTALRHIEALALLLGAPADGDADPLMGCALVAEAADMIREEAWRIREHLGYLPR